MKRQASVLSSAASAAWIICCQTILSAAMQSLFSASTLIFYFIYANLSDMFLGNKVFLQISTLFVVAGLLRYIQISHDEDMIEEPTDILFKYTFILISVSLWSLSIASSFIF